MDKKGNIDKLSMFTPISKHSLLSDYPELKKNENLNKLLKDDLLFCWYFACKSSPFMYEEDDRKRAELSLKASTSKPIADLKSNSYISGNFPEKIKLGINEMRKYEPGPRIRAKMMMEKIMQNYEKIINIDVDDSNEFNNKDGEVDWAKKKSYIDSCAVVAKNLPFLISQSEGSFGISEEKDGQSFEDLDDGSLIADFHSE